MEQMNKQAFDPEEIAVLVGIPESYDMCTCYACKCEIRVFELRWHWQTVTNSRFLGPGQVVGIARCRLGMFPMFGLPI
jgi:hypothetical protein